MLCLGHRHDSEHLIGENGIEIFGKFMHWMVTEKQVKNSSTGFRVKVKSDSILLTALKAYLSALKTYFCQRFVADSSRINVLEDDSYSRLIRKTGRINNETRQSLGLPFNQSTIPSSFEEVRVVIRQALVGEDIESATIIGLQVIKGGRASDICGDILHSNSPSIDRSSGRSWIHCICTSIFNAFGAT